MGFKNIFKYIDPWPERDITGNYSKKYEKDFMKALNESLKSKRVPIEELKGNKKGNGGLSASSSYNKNVRRR